MDCAVCHKPYTDTHICSTKPPKDVLRDEPSAKQRVRQAYPRSRVLVLGDAHSFGIVFNSQHTVELFYTEAEAWEDAASKLSPVPPSPKTDLQRIKESYSSGYQQGYPNASTTTGPAFKAKPAPSEGLIKEAEETMKPTIRRVRSDLFFVEWGNVRFGGTFLELATFAAELQAGMTKALSGDAEDKSNVR